MSDDDVSIDLKKLKNIFKKPRSKSKKKEENNNDLVIDTKIISKNIGKFSIIFLLLIPILLTTYLRLIPADLPQADNWAKSSVYNFYRNQIRTQIDQNYPNLPAQDKNNLIEEQFQQYLKENSGQAEQQIAGNADFLRDKFRGDNGITYLGDIDSYHWLRYAKNIVNTGVFADEIRDGKYYDTKMVAPLGYRVYFNIYPYIEAYLYQAVKIINPAFTFVQSAYYTPLFLAIIAIIAAFFIGKRTAGNIGGLVASIIIAVHPMILSRSLGSDNDIVNIVFPLLILWFFVEGLGSKDKKITFVMTAISGLFIGFYSIAWTGYWMMLYFLSGSLIAYLGYNFTKDILFKRNLFGPEEKKAIISLFILVIAACASIAFVNDINEVTSLPNKVIRVTTLKTAARGGSIWPNVYTTVAELNEASVKDMVNNVGGNLLFILALTGIAISLTDFKTKKLLSAGYLVASLLFYAFLISSKDSLSMIMFVLGLAVPYVAGILLSLKFEFKNVDVKYTTILIMWFISSVYASSKGIRFILAIIPPYAVSLGLFAGKLTSLLPDIISKEIQIPKNISKAMLIIMIAIIIISPIKAGKSVADNYVPSINDAWIGTLTKIRTESAPDAIINSWWDFGHWFKYYTNRSVTADGASQNQPQAHWLGKLLLTDDEKQAVSILRMLDCGSNSAYNIINNELNDQLKSINLVYEIIALDEPKARVRLSQELPADKVEQVLKTTHCDPPEDYLITSQDMVSKSGVWAHFGIWSFERTDIYNNFKESNVDSFVKTMQDEYGFSAEDSTRTYYDLLGKTTDRQVNDWIAPWPTYAGSSGCTNSGTKAECAFLGIPLTIDLDSYEATLDINGETCYVPEFAYVQDGEYKVKKYSDNLYWDCLARLNSNQQVPRLSIAYRGNDIILMDPALTGSMFTRMFYFNGAGLNNFEKFDDVTDVTGQRIITWKVKW